MMNIFIQQNVEKIAKFRFSFPALKLQSSFNFIGNDNMIFFQQYVEKFDFSSSLLEIADGEKRKKLITFLHDTIHYK